VVEKISSKAREIMSRSCGALQKLTDPAGNVTAWDWNIIGQNLSKTYADGRKFAHTIANSPGVLLACGAM